MTVTEFSGLDDVLAWGSENFSWQVVDRGPAPDDDVPGDDPVHAESARAAWLHRLYALQQRQISTLQAGAWETLQQIQNLPRPPLPAGSTLPAAAAPDAYELAESELMARHQVSRGQADHRLDEAHAVTGLPAVLGLVKTGRLSAAHARHIARTITNALPGTGDPALDAERRRQVEAGIIERAPGMTTRQLTYAIRRIVAEIDPDAARREHQAEKTRCHVKTWQDHSGMGFLEARLPDDAVAVIDTALDLLANAARNAARNAAHCAGTPLDDIGKTHGQRKANALHRIFEAILNGTALTTGTSNEGGVRVPVWWQPPPLPTRKRRRPHLVLRVDLPTLTGDTDWAGTLEGYGTISADLARKIAAQCGSIDILKTDAYRATARISSQIAARHRTCRFPGCDIPAHDCDDDHVIPYDRGGPTSPANQIPACRRHHRMKTHAGWRVHLHDDGTVDWTSPTGATFTKTPPTD